MIIHFTKKVHIKKSLSKTFIVFICFLLIFNLNIVKAETSIDESVNKKYTLHVQDNYSNISYKDEDSGIEFSLPTGWAEVPLTKPRKTIDVKFSPNEDSVTSLMFGATDFYAELDDTEKATIKRSDINNSYLSIDDISLLANVDTFDICEIEYNDISYYCFQTNYSTELYGSSISIVLTHALHIENGWMYWFQFGPGKDNPYYEEFEQVLNSVSIGGTTVQQNTSAESQKNDSYYWIFILFGVTIIVFLIVFIIKEHRKRIKNNTIKNSNLDERVSCHNNCNYYCRICGTKVDVTADYCHKCGTRIES